MRTFLYPFFMAIVCIVSFDVRAVRVETDSHCSWCAFIQRMPYSSQSREKLNAEWQRRLAARRLQRERAQQEAQMVKLQAIFKKQQKARRAARAATRHARKSSILPVFCIEETGEEECDEGASADAATHCARSELAALALCDDAAPPADIVYGKQEEDGIDEDFARSAQPHTDTEVPTESARYARVITSRKDGDLDFLDAELARQAAELDAALRAEY